jgi:hypothetical protein
MADRTLVGSQQPTLEQGDGAMHTRQHVHDGGPDAAECDGQARTR